MSTATFPLDQSTRLIARDDGRFASSGGAAYWNFQSAFGGWALALALEAVRAGHPQPALIASVSAQFMKPLPEQGLTLAVAALRAGRLTDFVRVEGFAGEETASPLFTADFVLSDPRDDALDYTVPCPAAIPPEQSVLLPSSPGPRWLANYEQRLAEGTPFSAQDHPRTLAWVRDASGRPWDEKAILALSDTPMPRTFFLDPAPRFSATVSFAFHLHASRAEIAALGDGFLLVETTASRVARRRLTQDVRIWSAAGALLAVSHQLAFY